MSDVPSQMLAWRLTGAGIENFGDGERPHSMPVPACSDDQLLMKVEAIGLCFSDVKLIRAGAEHPRVLVDDLAAEPVIPGHEAVLTVVAVGQKLRERFEVGQRFIIQADIYHKGTNIAYGYAIDGGMAQYSLMTEPILEGDEGCYLLPISDKLSAAEAALIEPWTCVIASYRIKFRTGLKAGGLLRIVGDGTPSNCTLDGLLKPDALPGRIIHIDLDGSLRRELEDASARFGVPIEEAETNEAADDLIVVGTHEPFALEVLATQVERKGVFCLVGEYDACDVPIDVGRIHYNYWRYIGTRGPRIVDAYTSNTRNMLRQGGTAWFPGGAGAMGQMHVQLAVEGEDGPHTIVVSDLDNERLGKLESRLAHKVRERGVEVHYLNPKEFGSEESFYARLRELAPKGFDDVVMLVPVPAVVSACARLLADGGLMNIFAGIPAGSNATLDLSGIVSRSQRYIASSGSSMADIRHTLELTESGKLSPVYALGAVGGMKALKEAMQGVMDARFPGKTVIYPQAVDMPLVAVEDIESVCPGTGETLLHGEVYTLETERRVRGQWENC